MFIVARALWYVFKLIVNFEIITTSRPPRRSPSMQINRSLRATSVVYSTVVFLLGTASIINSYRLLSNRANNNSTISNSHTIFMLLKACTYSCVLFLLANLQFCVLFYFVYVFFFFYSAAKKKKMSDTSHRFLYIERF